MMALFGLGLTALFYSFYTVGGLVAESANKRRLADLQEAARKVPAGLGSLSERFVSPSTQGRLRRRLLEAGQPRDLDLDGLMALKAVSSVVGLVLAIVLAGSAGFSAGRVLMLAGICGLIGFFGPDLWLSRLIDKRQRQISQSLPDILDMLTISVEAGLGFDAAISKVVMNFKGVLSQEFFRWLQEVQLGRTRKQAWRDLADRINVPEVNSFILAILQADTFGISIGTVLRVQADEMRTRRRQRAEEAAMKTPVKVVFPLVLCIFPALMIVILGPAGIKIVQSFG